ADFMKRFTGPIVGGQVESVFQLLEHKEEPLIIYLGGCNKHAVATIVPKGIGQKFDKGFLQKQRINTYHRVAELRVPIDFRSFSGAVAADFVTQMVHGILSRLRR